MAAPGPRLSDATASDGGTIPSVRDPGGSTNPLAAFAIGDFCAYHGTSAAYVESIERAGLGGPNSSWSTEDCRLVCGAFEKLMWHGTTRQTWSANGYAVLAASRESRDEGISGNRHVYLAETFARATRYASIPGGEIADALTSCLADWNDLVTKRDLRASHRASLIGDIESLGLTLNQARRFASSSQDAPPAEQYAAKQLSAMSLLDDDEWLVATNRSFDGLRSRLEHVRAMHRPIVYLVELDEERLRQSRYGNGGIEITVPIPVTQLRGKAIDCIKRPQQATSREDLDIMNKWGEAIANFTRSR